MGAVETHVLNPGELDRLALAIGEAERGTSGEMRLIIARRSLVMSHIEPIIWLVTVAVGLLALWTARSHPLIEEHALWLVPALLGAAAVLSVPLARVETLKRALTTARDRQHAVWARAELEFYREGLTKTKEGTGILLFLSLFEKQAVVLGDYGIAKRLPKSIWEDVVAQITKGARTGELARELEGAIRLCGEHLRTEFPAGPENVNELSNAVLLKD